MQGHVQHNADFTVSLVNHIGCISAIRLLANLKVVSPVVGDDVEAEPVVGHRLHLAGEEVDLGGLLALVGVVDVEESFAHLALSPLPHVPQPPLGALVQEARLPVARVHVALGLVQGVRVPNRRGPILLKGERKFAVIYMHCFLLHFGH